jgi:hypothetical protein
MSAAKKQSILQVIEQSAGVFVISEKRIRRNVITYVFVILGISIGKVLLFSTHFLD